MSLMNVVADLHLIDRCVLRRVQDINAGVTTPASSNLMSLLPSSFRQPHSVHCPPGPPYPAHITFSQILSSIVTLIPSGLPSWILTCTELKGHWLCLF